MQFANRIHRARMCCCVYLSLSLSVWYMYMSTVKRCPHRNIWRRKKKEHTHTTPLHHRWYALLQSLATQTFGQKCCTQAKLFMVFSYTVRDDILNNIPFHETEPNRSSLPAKLLHWRTRLFYYNNAGLSCVCASEYVSNIFPLMLFCMHARMFRK